MVAEQLKHQRQRGHPKAPNRDTDGGGGKGCHLFSNDWRPDTRKARGRRGGTAMPRAPCAQPPHAGSADMAGRCGPSPHCRVRQQMRTSPPAPGEPRLPCAAAPRSAPGGFTPKGRRVTRSQRTGPNRMAAEAWPALMSQNECFCCRAES